MGLLKIWNGSSWYSPSGWNRPKIWNGSSWVTVNPLVWDGSTWLDIEGATVTTGSGGTYFPGGKGVEYYTTFLYGYSTSNAFGSVSGTVLGAPVIEFYWGQTIYEVSPTVNSVIVELTGNVASTYSAYVDGVAITGPKAGGYNSGTNKTVFYWGTDVGDSVIGANPFGGNGTTHTVALA